MNVVSFSSGLSSALTAVRVLDKYPDAKLVFLDTKFEDEDNYRFMSDFENKFGIEILKISEGRTPYDVFEDQHVIPNNLVAPCTGKLKLELFKKWLSEQEKPITIYIGYDYLEVHRCDATKRNYESLGYSVDFPLLWKPLETRKYTTISKNEWGIEPPRMYGLGYTHANCGGRCIKQGQGDWLRTLANFPDRFKFCEEWEQYMRKEFPKSANYAILKVVRNGEVLPYPLKNLREDYESRISKMDNNFLEQFDMQSACVVCGVGA